MDRWVRVRVRFEERRPRARPRRQSYTYFYSRILPRREARWIGEYEKRGPFWEIIREKRAKNSDFLPYGTK